MRPRCSPTRAKPPNRCGRRYVNWPDSRPSFCQHTDIRQMPVLLGKVQPITDDEFVFDGEADVTDFYVDLPARWFTQETRGAQRLRIARAQNLLQIMQRQAGVDDVLDDNHVAALETVV